MARTFGKRGGGSAGERQLCWKPVRITCSKGGGALAAEDLCLPSTQMGKAEAWVLTWGTGKGGQCQGPCLHSLHSLRLDPNEVEGAQTGKGLEALGRALSLQGPLGDGKVGTAVAGDGPSWTSGRETDGKKGIWPYLSPPEGPHSLMPPRFLVQVSPIPGLGGPEDFCLKTPESFIMARTSFFKK